MHPRGLEVKCDSMECGSYRGIELLEHPMKVVKRIFKYRIRQQIDTDDMQFAIMKCKGTTTFIIRQMQEKFRAKGKMLYFGFVDLEEGKAWYAPRFSIKSFSVCDCYGSFI